MEATAALEGAKRRRLRAVVFFAAVVIGVVLLAEAVGDTRRSGRSAAADVAGVVHAELGGNRREVPPSAVIDLSAPSVPADFRIGATNMAPGDSVTGTVTVRNGRSPAMLTLHGENGEATRALPSVMALTVVDEAAGLTVFAGPFADFDRVELCRPDGCRWKGNESRTYRITVAFDETAGNEFQDASAVLDFVWSATRGGRP